MRREVAVWTEWAWARGQLEDNADKLVFGGAVLCALHARHPSSRVYIRTALVEILQDVEKTLRVLGYGGRRPESLSEERRAWLDTRCSRSEIADNLRSQAA